VLKIHEATRKDGTLAEVFLVERDDILLLVDDQGEHPLPERALDAVMRRYGRELAGAMPDDETRLVLSSGATLVRFRFKGAFDVIARDYIAYAVPDEPPVCELATAVAAALAHLARARPA
jgi:hypothetical protein